MLLMSRWMVGLGCVVLLCVAMECRAHIVPEQLQLVAAVPYTSFRFMPPMALLTVGAYNQTVIGTDEGNCYNKDATGANVAASPTRGFAEAAFTLPSDGLYYFQASFYAPDTLADSFHLQFDTGAKLSLTIGLPRAKYLVPRVVNVAGAAPYDALTEESFWMRGGSHTLRFYVREPGAALSALNVSKTGLIAIETVRGCSPCAWEVPNRLTITLMNFCGPSCYSSRLILIQGLPCDEIKLSSSETVECTTPAFSPTNTPITLSLNATVPYASSTAFTLTFKAVPFRMPAWAIVLVVLGALLVVALVAAGYFVRQHMLTAAAPKDASRAFYYMFLVLKGETRLWERYPETMASAAPQLATLIRHAICSNGCYEVRKMNTSFAVACKSLDRALGCAASVQRALSTVSFQQKFMAEVQLRRRNRARSHAESRGSSRVLPEKYQRQSSGELHSNTSDTDRKMSCTATPTHSATRSNASEETSAICENVSYGVGIHFATGRVIRDEANGSYDYAGEVVERAALVADCAAGGQVLVSRAVVMESSQSTAAASNRFKLLTTKTLGEWECELHQYNVPGMAERTFTVADDNDDNVDSVAMALQQSAGAVQKKVTVLEVAFSPMGQVSVQEQAKLMSQLHADLAAVVSYEKGVVAHADSFRFTITFNCAAAASLQAQRAVRTAVELAGWAQYGRAMCGIASCRQIVVRTSGSSGETYHIIGNAISQATLLRQLCGCYEAASILTTDALAQDLATSARVQCVDACFMPSAEGPDKKVALVLSVLGLKESDANDEWMYELEKADACDAHAAPNRAFASLHQGDAKPAEAYLQALPAGETSAAPAASVLRDIVQNHHADLADYCASTMPAKLARCYGFSL